MLLPITAKSLPKPGAKITDGKRLMEVEEIDSEGNFWLDDCAGDFGEIGNPEKLHLEASALVAGHWKRIVRVTREDKRVP